MKVIKISQNTDEWLDFRKGKVSGSKLKDMVSKRGGTKKGFYQLIADRLEEPAEYEDARERGHRLEEEGLYEFELLKDLEVDKDCGIWQSDVNPNIIVSPDGGIKIDGKYVAAVEMKALNGANHIQAVLENKIPSEYWEQALQYFAVNEELETLYFTFYHPGIVARKLHVIELKREDVKEYVDELLKFEIEQLAKIDKIIAELAF